MIFMIDMIDIYKKIIQEYSVYALYDDCINTFS